MGSYDTGSKTQLFLYQFTHPSILATFPVSSLKKGLHALRCVNLSTRNCVAPVSPPPLATRYLTNKLALQSSIILSLLKSASTAARPLSVATALAILCLKAMLLCTLAGFSFNTTEKEHIAHQSSSQAPTNIAPPFLATALKKQSGRIYTSYTKSALHFECLPSPSNQPSFVNCKIMSRPSECP